MGNMNFEDITNEERAMFSILQKASAKMKKVAEEDEEDEKPRGKKKDDKKGRKKMIEPEEIEDTGGGNEEEDNDCGLPKRVPKAMSKDVTEKKGIGNVNTYLGKHLKSKHVIGKWKDEAAKHPHLIAFVKGHREGYIKHGGDAEGHKSILATAIGRGHPGPDEFKNPTHAYKSGFRDGRNDGINDFGKHGEYKDKDLLIPIKTPNGISFMKEGDLDIDNAARYIKQKAKQIAKEGAEREPYETALGSTSKRKASMAGRVAAYLIGKEATPKARVYSGIENLQRTGKHMKRIARGAETSPKAHHMAVKRAAAHEKWMQESHYDIIDKEIDYKLPSALRRKGKDTGMASVHFAEAIGTTKKKPAYKYGKLAAHQFGKVYGETKGLGTVDPGKELVASGRHAKKIARGAMQGPKAHARARQAAAKYDEQFDIDKDITLLDTFYEGGERPRLPVRKSMTGATGEFYKDRFETPAHVKPHGFNKTPVIEETGEFYLD